MEAGRGNGWFRSILLRANATDAPPPSSSSTSMPFVCFRLGWARALGVFNVDVLGRLFFFVVAGAILGSSTTLAPGATVDLRARFGAGRGVLVATLAVRVLFGVARVVVDLRGERRLNGDSPFTPRSSSICARALPSAGTKILVWISVVSSQESPGYREERERTHHGRESVI
jgi:hypothetical protein